MHSRRKMTSAVSPNHPYRARPTAIRSSKAWRRGPTITLAGRTTFRNCSPERMCNSESSNSNNRFDSQKPTTERSLFEPRILNSSSTKTGVFCVQIRQPSPLLGVDRDGLLDTPLHRYVDPPDRPEFQVALTARLRQRYAHLRDPPRLIRR